MIEQKTTKEIINDFANTLNGDEVWFRKDDVMPMITQIRLLSLEYPLTKIGAILGYWANEFVVPLSPATGSPEHTGASTKKVGVAEANVYVREGKEVLSPPSASVKESKEIRLRR